MMNKDKLMEYASAIKTYCEDKDGCDECLFYREYNYGGIKHWGCALNGNGPIDWDELDVTYLDTEVTE